MVGGEADALKQVIRMVRSLPRNEPCTLVFRDMARQETLDKMV